MVGPDSHSGDIGPDGEGVQVKHGLTPAVNGQCNTQDSNEVHDYSCSGLVEKKSMQ